MFLCLKTEKKACTLIEAHDFDLVITDIRLGNIDGIEALRKAKAKDSDVPVIMISAFLPQKLPLKR